MEWSSTRGNNTISLSAIILAGGRSSRMGQDKALLEIQGIPMLRLVYDTASAVCDSVCVVTPWIERYQDLLPASCQWIREVPLPGESPVDVTTSSKKVTLPLPHGPLVGFAQGLAQVKTDWVLLLACDLPRLRVEVLQDWKTRLHGIGEEALADGGGFSPISPKRTPSSPIAVLTCHAKGWEPLCGFYRRSCLPLVTNFIEQGGRSFQQWLAQHQVQVLPLPNPQMLFNCNTPSDLAAARSLDLGL